MSEIVRGAYRHFKGGVYIVTGTATHSETGEELVIYHKAGSGLLVSDEERKLWARPMKMWNEKVFRHGSEKPRFELLYTIPTIPDEDAQTAVQAHWYIDDGCAYCSNCKNNFHRGVKRIYRWCPMCGAKMEAE